MLEAAGAGRDPGAVKGVVEVALDLVAGLMAAVKTRVQEAAVELLSSPPAEAGCGGVPTTWTGLMDCRFERRRAAPCAGQVLDI